MADDWDLYAVVRNYATASAAGAFSSTIDASETTNQNENENENVPRGFVNADDPSDFPGFVSHQEAPFHGHQQIYQEQYEYNNLPANSVLQEQQQQYAPQFSLYQNSQHFVQQQQQQTQMILGSSSPLSFASATTQPIRSRRRKNQQEKTVHRMTQEELSADTWAWRKYGQKPIKGSPYPRNYYRCSTSKGCVARRQVERCPADPNMYVVSYSGQHSHPRPTHRSSLAGSTRTKSAAKASSGSGEAAVNNTAQTNTPVASSSSPAWGSSFSPAAEEGADAENQSAAEAEEEVEEWDDDQDEDDDGDGDDDNGDGEILIPNPFIDHY